MNKEVKINILCILVFGCVGAVFGTLLGFLINFVLLGIIGGLLGGLIFSVIIILLGNMGKRNKRRV